MEKEFLNEENFQNYVGLIYLDLEEKINDSELYYLGACLSFLFYGRSRMINRQYTANTSSYSL